MSTAIAIVAVALFVLALRLLGVMPRSVTIVRRTNSALAILAEPGRSDKEKETAARRASVHLFAGFAGLLALTLAAFLPAFAVVLVTVSLRVVTVQHLLASLVSYQVIVAALIFFVLDLLWRR